MQLEVRGNNDYFGPLYIGNEYTMVNMIYDTTSSYVIVNPEGLGNAELVSNYDIKESTTAKVVYSDKGETTPKMVD